MSYSNNNELAEMGVTTEKSEDIETLDNKVAKYLQLQNRIREVISTSATDRAALVKDFVDAFSKLGGSPTWWNIVSLGIAPIRRHFKRKKLAEVVENILRKMFDVTLGWYVMDYEDVKETCDHIGGRDCFGREDHRHIYIAVIQKLKEGKLRDRCIQLGIVDFVNEKIPDIRDNFLKFKEKEL